MKKLLETIHSLTGSSGRNPVPAGRFITIGDDVFVVAHSPKEIARAMKMKGTNVTGYVLSHRM